MEDYSYIYLNLYILDLLTTYKKRKSANFNKIAVNLYPELQFFRCILFNEEFQDFFSLICL